MISFFLLAVAGTLLGSPEVAANPAAAPAPQLHHGVDVSVHSGAVSWPELKEQGHRFAFVKATEGLDFLDGAFAGHWPALKDAGLIRGAYHFYVTEDDPEAQARWFIGAVKLEPGDLAPVLDIELIGHGTTLAGLPQRLQTWLDVVEGHYGIKPIIYTSPHFWNAHFGEGFGDYPLWIAEYGVSEPTLPTGWDTWHLWQWKGDATVPGVEKGADLSKVNPSVDLSTLVIPAATPGP